jgi:hydrogenase nickel incorporation protein HypA/HybF
LVRSLISQALQAMAPLPVERLRVIRLALGSLSGVEPLLVDMAFENLRNEYGLAACELQIDSVELAANCRSCGIDFVVFNYRFKCPACASQQTVVIRGDECQLVSLQVEEPIHAFD